MRHCRLARGSLPENSLHCGAQISVRTRSPPLVALLGTVPLPDDMGPFHAVIGGAGKVSVNFVSCREMLPEPGACRDCLQQAVDELLAAVG